MTVPAESTASTQPFLGEEEEEEEGEEEEREVREGREEEEEKEEEEEEEIEMESVVTRLEGEEEALPHLPPPPPPPLPLSFPLLLLPGSGSPQDASGAELLLESNRWTSLASVATAKR